MGSGQLLMLGTGSWLGVWEISMISIMLVLAIVVLVVMLIVRVKRSRHRRLLGKDMQPFTK